MRGETVLLPVLSRLFDAYFPRLCAGCGVRADRGIFCRVCAPVKTDPTSFEGGYYGYPYAGVFRQLLHDLKFNHRRDVLPVLRSLVTRELFAHYDIVIPVPSHWIRRLEHGCDPVRLIFHLQKGMVKRRRYTPAFHALGKDARAHHIDKVFGISQPQKIIGANILIVDDIYTTGTTFRELKQTLLSVGAASVDGYFLTRA